MLKRQPTASLHGEKEAAHEHRRRLAWRKADLVAFTLRVSAASGQALFQRDAAFGDRDAVSCDFHCVLSVAVSGLCQQQQN